MREAGSNPKPGLSWASCLFVYPLSLSPTASYLVFIRELPLDAALPIPVAKHALLISCTQRVNDQAFKIMALAICRLLFWVSQKLLGALGFCYVLTYDSLETSPDLDEEISGNVPPSWVGFWIKRYTQNNSHSRTFCPSLLESSAPRIQHEQGKDSESFFLICLFSFLNVPQNP